MDKATKPSLCLIDRRWQAKPQEGNERPSKQTCMAAYKSRAELAVVASKRTEVIFVGMFITVRSRKYGLK